MFDSDTCHAVYLLAPHHSLVDFFVLCRILPLTHHIARFFGWSIQMILARTLPCFEMVEKNSVGSDDIIYRSVAYMAAHFREDFSLTQMAEDLGYSPYALSRVFSSTFHCNFNTYLNNIRYSCNLLQHSDRSITDICHSAGFGSLRTFNRTFLNTYKMSPRDYRKMICEV